MGTSYGPSYFSETKLDDNIQRVTFRGGQHPATGELCLLRCAEVCLAEGFSHFEVVDSETGNSFQNDFSYYPFDRYYPGRNRFMDDIPFVAKTIRLFNSVPVNEFAYKAEQIKSSLKRKYQIE